MGTPSSLGPACCPTPFPGGRAGCDADPSALMGVCPTPSALLTGVVGALPQGSSVICQLRWNTDVVYGKIPGKLHCLTALPYPGHRCPIHLPPKQSPK